MAQMLHGGVDVEVTNLGQAKIAEFIGERCVVVSGPRVKEIPRMADPSVIEKIMAEVSIPVMMAKVRVGHFAESEIVESIGVNYIDESEITGIANANNFINKHDFGAAFVCGCRDLGEALRRITEGSAMVRIQGDSSGSGDIATIVHSVRKLMAEIRDLTSMDEDEVFAFCERIRAPHDVVSETKLLGKLPVAQFAAGGITTVADAALMMKLGCDGVFVGEELLDGKEASIKAIVDVVTLYNNPTELKEGN